MENTIPEGFYNNTPRPVPLLEVNLEGDDISELVKGAVICVL